VGLYAHCTILALQHPLLGFLVIGVLAVLGVLAIFVLVLGVLAVVIDILVLAVSAPTDRQL
jgi:hypothetical protein